MVAGVIPCHYSVCGYQEDRSDGSPGGCVRSCLPHVSTPCLNTQSAFNHFGAGMHYLLNICSVAVLGGQCPCNSESGPPCGPPERGVCINNKMTYNPPPPPLGHYDRPHNVLLQPNSVNRK